MAMMLMLAGLWLATSAGTVETFVAPILNKDAVRNRRNLWLQEEILSEDPHGIQERTDNPAILLDKVTEEESASWLDEELMDVHPEAIQERPVSTYSDYYESGTNSGASSMGRM
jgi:hypothetical protein